MKSFGSYISKYLVSFVAFILILLFLNAVVFGLTFQKIVTEDYGDSSPQAMLEMTATAATPEQLSDEAVQMLRQNHIWAIYLNTDGQCYWSVDLPDNVPKNYTIQDVALFSKGYIEDYPVFIWNTDDGLLVLGYPTDSYTKLTSNYYSIAALQRLPIFVLGMLGLDLLCLFSAYYFSKRRIIHNTEPIVSAVKTLADGKPVSLHISGELSEIASSVNKASSILNRQNEARANWISGVSHDIRTPLSMIMGYADRITSSLDVGENTRKQANIIKIQSVKIKNLVQDLNLVSQLNYNVQPVKQTPVHLCKMIREIVVEYLNNNLNNKFDFELNLDCNTEQISIIGDERLLYRAIQNIISNSINHNENGCTISVSLAVNGNNLILVISDNGKGISEEKLQKIQSTPHYLQSTDERLDLRHGLGLLLVKEIISIHNGTVSISSALNNGFSTTISLPIKKQ